MDSSCIPVELICIPADSSLIPVDSSGFQRNPVIPAGMVGGVTSTEMVSDPAMVMFVDEAAKNKKNPSRKIGWSLKGQRVVERRCFVRGQRFSILPVLTLDGIIAHDIIPGSVTSNLFVKFLREHVVCSTCLYCFLP